MTIFGLELVTRRPDIDPGRFAQEWPDRTVEAGSGQVLEHERNLVVDSEQRGISYPRGIDQFDGFTFLSCTTVPALTAAVESDRRDTADICSTDQAFRVVRNVVVEPPAPDTVCLKRISTLFRRPDVDTDTFSREWKVEHARRVRLMPGILGYVQNHPVAGVGTPPAQGDADPAAVDGIVELWFTDMPSLTASFASDPGRNTMAHAREFIGQISTYLVSPRPLR